MVRFLPPIRINKTIKLSRNVPVTSYVNAVSRFKNFGDILDDLVKSLLSLFFGDFFVIE